MAGKSFRWAVLFFLVVAAVPGWTQDSWASPPETLLAEESVLYLRFDGLGSHEDAYQRTALAQLLRNEFGPLIDDLTQRILDALGPRLLSERLLEGAKPDQLLKVQNANKQMPQLLEYLGQNGFAVGAEVIALFGHRFQVTVVFPNGGRQENRSGIFGAIQLLGLMTQTEVEEANVEDRMVLRLNTPDPVKVACWQEGEHIVLTIGTEEVEHTLELVMGKRKNLTTNKVYQQLADFQQYETIKRGFFDLDRVSTIAKTAFPPAETIIEQLGLSGLKNATFHIGFADQHIRTTFRLDMPGERKGLLRVLSTTDAVEIEQLPAFPPDAVMVGANRFEIGTAYDATIETIELAVSMTNPQGVADWKRGLKELEEGMGVDLRTDLFGTLGSNIIAYNSPSEGPLNMGTVVAVEVKDEKKLAESLDTLIKSLAATTGAVVYLKSREYRGATLNTVHVGERGFPFVPSYTIHRGWIAVSFYPQPVQGFILRSDGKHAVWSLPDVAKRVVQDVTKDNPEARIIGINVSDPRPALAEALSLAPFVTQMIYSFTGATADFDIAVIPNAQSTTERLSHNVSVIVDDGKSVRIEGYSSLPVPAQLNGISSYLYISAFSFLRFTF